jgi:Cu(I)/Ag(I) efflux system membrane fusion protein
MSETTDPLIVIPIPPEPPTTPGDDRVVRLAKWLAGKTALIPVLLACLAIGYFLHWALSPAVSGRPTSQSASTQPPGPKKLYVCPMNFAPHAYFSSTDPDEKCVYCGMPLKLAKNGSAQGDPKRTVLSDVAVKLLDVQTSPVVRMFPQAEIRMVGKIDFDETKLAYITAWVPGRLDRLFVDYTGVPVRKGDHMVELYSPELLSAQEELLAGIKAVKELKDSDLAVVRKSTLDMVKAAREKLRLWGLAPEQIEAIEKSAKASDHITIRAPVGGIVIHKNAQQGMYVKTGDRIYTIVDLKSVWVNLRAYESDLMWLRYGQKVQFTSVAYPGKKFSGTISFIDPVLDARTRTVKVRVNASNADGRLKPGMFVKAAVRAKIAAGGKVMDAALADKWMCPMHPSVIKDTAGICDICEMDIVTAKSLGYVSGVDATNGDKPLVIPAAAALLTGKRAVVYVRVKDKPQPTFEFRTVELGLRAGGYYIVRKGLKEGERVVTRGNFAIDSERQLSAKPSMLDEMKKAPDKSAKPKHHEPVKPIGGLPKEFTRQLSDVFDAYFAVSKALAGDDLKGSIAAVEQTQKALAAVDMKLLKGDTHMAWMKVSASLGEVLKRAGGAGDIKILRKDFEPLSIQMISLAKRFGTLGRKLFVHRCPMAFDNRGANWLQADDKTLNPYFGAAMLKCGGVIETIEGGGR